MLNQQKQRKLTLMAGLIVVALMTTSCRPNEPPVLWSLTVPEPNELEFGAELTSRYGIGLTAEFDIEDWGRVFVEGETPQQGFQFGFALNTGVFEHDAWIGYQEVTALPTGASFPNWMLGKVVDIEVPPLNISDEVEWHLYLGTRGKFYLGLAAVMKFIGADFPDLDIQYSFYDDSGNVILGLVFFGPDVVNGQLRSPGGIFVGTDLTPLLPDGVFPVDPDGSVVLSGADVGSSSQALMFQPSVRSKVIDSSRMINARTARALDWADRANRGEEIRLGGQTITSDIELVGRHARGYRGKERKIRGLVDRFARASRK